MKWLISTTYGVEFDELMDILNPNTLKYCRKWGYDYNVHHAKFNGDSVYYNANLNLIKEMLPYYDAVLLIDADVMFLRHDISLDSIFRQDADQQIAKEALNQFGSPINAGVVMLRNVPGSVELIDRLLSDRPKYNGHPWVWQKQLWDMYQDEDPLMKRFAIVSANTMNSHAWPGFECSYKDGDFIVHFFCTAYKEKIRKAKEFMQKVRYE